MNESSGLFDQLLERYANCSSYSDHGVSKHGNWPAANQHSNLLETRFSTEFQRGKLLDFKYVMGSSFSHGAPDGEPMLKGRMYFDYQRCFMTMWTEQEIARGHSKMQEHPVEDCLKRVSRISSLPLLLLGHPPEEVLRFDRSCAVVDSVAPGAIRIREEERTRTIDIATTIDSQLITKVVDRLLWNQSFTNVFTEETSSSSGCQIWAVRVIDPRY